jgi:hypothetical protein
MTIRDGLLLMENIINDLPRPSHHISVPSTPTNDVKWLIFNILPVYEWWYIENNNQIKGLLINK